MEGVFILLAVVIGIALLGKWALNEGRRIENHKKFMNNMKKFDKKR